MSEATIYDVARLAGVSKTTVSRVIAGSDAVVEKTRKKVEEAMIELQYTPSMAAQVLSAGKSNVVGVIVPDSSEYFFSQMLKGIYLEMEKNHMVVIQLNSYHDPERESNALQTIAHYRVRGLIMTPVQENYSNQQIKKRLDESMRLLSAPVVFVDRSIEDKAVDRVLFDNYRGGYLAAEKMVADNIAKIGMLVVDTDLQLGKDRYDGFIDGLKAHGLEPEPDCVFTAQGQIAIEEVARISNILLDKLAPGGAVYLSNGFLSKIFLREVLNRGLVLGEDIRCAAFDRIELLETFTKLPFHYIERSEAEMGRLAAQMLMERIQGLSIPDRKCIIPAKGYDNL